MRVLLTFLLVVMACGCDDGLLPGGVGSAGLPSSGHRSTGPPPTGGPPTGDLRLNELLASNRRGRRDDQGRSSDWIEIHNSGNQPLQLGGYHLTDDLKDLDKWAFPNSRISAGGYQLVWMSGSTQHGGLPPDALKPSKTPTPFETTLVKHGANWKYALGGAGQKSFTNKSVKGWTAVDFDDGAFAVGPAGIGYGDDDDATTVPDGTTVVLARHTFTLNEPLGSQALILQMDYDDGFAAYLNGTRVAAAGCRDEEEPNLDSLAKDSHDAGTAERFDLSKHSELLRPGKNVLAIAGLNISTGSSDLSLAPALGTLATASHANFRLKKSGDTLYLISPEEKIVDQIRYPKQVTDQSLGRVPSTRSSWRYFLTPSPGSSNTGPHRNRPIKSRLSYSPEAIAFKPGEHIRILQQSSTDLDIRFTSDGSAPDASSRLYRDPITLNETTLFRAAAFSGREQVGDTVTATCLVGRQPTLPVMSISLKPEDFVDVHLQKSGKGRGSERPAFLEVFTPAGKRGAATGFGLRLHGGAGRRGDITTKKSYRAYFRGVYGDKRLDYDIIPNAGIKNFDKLVLRANFGDGHAHGAYIRDQVIRELHADMGGLCSNGSWYVLLVNLKNQGVFNVVERMDDEFFVSHLGPGDYDVVKTGDRVISGTRDGWSELRRFIRSRDFSNQANFDELARRVDIENFTAYVILNFWAQNFDWPHNNWYAARRAPQGKWFFLCWDAEWGLGGGDYDPDVDPYAFIDSGGAYGHSMIRALFFAMIGNPGYCKYYQQEVRRHLRGALSTANALRHVHRNRDAIANDIEHEFDVRGYDKQHWRGQIAEIESFVRGGGEIFQQYTDAYFSHKNPGRSDDRIALTEAADGRRHALYRTAKGQLRELSSAADGTTWSDKSITIPGTIPASAGRPSVYSLPQAGRRILYRGEKGHLHELSRPAENDTTVAWQHNDLTTQLNLPVAGCDPSVVVARGIPHIVYVDQTCQAHEVWLDEKWRHHPLPAAPRPATDAVITYTSSALQVTYRTMFGAVCEQNLLLKNAENDKRKWSHRLVFGSPAKGSPRGFSPKSIRHLVFRSAEKWPLRQPFVSGVKTVRERETPIPRSALVHAWYDGKRFWHLEPIENPASEIVGDPCVIHNVPTTRFHFAYRDARGHIIETTFRSEDIPQGGSWHLADPTTLADAPPAAGEPAGLFSARTGSRFYVYRGRDGHLHELRFDGSWTHRDLTAAATGSFSKPSR